MSSVEQLTKFFDLIHGASDGWRCLFSLPDKRHYWFKDSESLAKKALQLDAQGLAVFHGCATFREKKRKQDYVEWIRSFWVDCDAGIGKPYGTAGQAYGAIEEWRKHVALPSPQIVASGGGIHAYWPLRDPLDRRAWERGAATLLKLVQEGGLQVDSGSTIDPARILRPPGTHNRKVFDTEGRKLADVGGEPRPVRMGPLVGPYDISELGVLFDGRRDAEIPAYLVHGADLVDIQASGLLNIYAEDRTADPEMVATACAQVRRLRDSRGNLPEPDWYAVLGILVRCGEPGRTAAHAWSSGDPRYSADDCEKKLNHASQSPGPTTCQRFGELNPLGCVGCPHAGRITSPIQLGREIPTSVIASAPRIAELPHLPEPFFWSGSRLATKRAVTEADPSPHHIVSEYPVLVSELQEAERSGGISAVFRAWEPSKNDWREFVLNLRDVCGDRGNSFLAHHGVVIEKKRADYMRSYIATMANQHKGTKAYGTRYEQFGWKQDGFLVGLDLVRPTDSPLHVFGSPEVTRRSEFLKAKGDLAAWSQAATALLGKEGFEGHAFMALCSFAAPLYSLAGATGGTIVHAVSMRSGEGKTVALEIGANAWGTLSGLRLKERDTAVAKFITIGTLGNLPVVYDELRSRGPDAAEILKEFVLHYTLGEDKARGATEGGLKNDALPWSNILISTANISLLDTCLSDGSETAQAARIFEFTLSLPKGVKTSEGDRLMEVVRTNCGNAGRVFIQWVLGNIDWVKDAIKRAGEMWETKLSATTEQRYSIRLLAAVSVALVIVNKLGILALDVKRLTQFAEKVAVENASRLLVQAQPDPAVILSRMMNDLVPNTLVMPGPTPKGANANARYEALREPRGELKARQEIEGREFLIALDAVRAWMQQHNVPMTEIGRKLKERGIVKDLRTRRTLGAGWRRVTGQVWCWQIDGAHEEIAEVFVGSVGEESNVIQLKGAIR